MTLRLDKIDQGENQVHKKSAVAGTSASLTFVTPGADTYADVSFTGDDGVATAIIDVGNSPLVSGTIVWTHATGATLTLKPFRSHDSAMAVLAPPPVIPSVAASGSTPAYPNSVPFAKADWTISGTTTTVSFEIETRGFRFWKFQLKSNTNDGSAIVRLGGGSAA